MFFEKIIFYFFIIVFIKCLKREKIEKRKKRKENSMEILKKENFFHREVQMRLNFIIKKNYFLLSIYSSSNLIDFLNNFKCCKRLN